LGIGAINPNKPSFMPPVIQQAPNKVVEDQLQNLMRMGFFGGKKMKLPKLPQAPVIPKQVQANRAIEAMIPTLIKKTEKTKEAQDTDNNQKLEEAMDKMEETLQEILKLTPKNKDNGSKNQNEMTKNEHLALYYEIAENYYEDLQLQGASKETLALYATIFYERISKPEYNSGQEYALAHCFKSIGDKAPSLFRGELMFNYMIDLTLKYPLQLKSDFLAPLKALTDLLTSKPRGIPGFYPHLMTIEIEHWETLLKVWTEMALKYPFSQAFPIVFGEEGCNALAEWVWELFMQHHDPKPDDMLMIEKLGKGFGQKFQNALTILLKNSRRN